ncbi:glycine betaine/L-proline ABC transporter ATP-binding protein [Salinibacterium sp. SYSU T00001]|uniref:quaternary amine ABC transporter ATP-binding protein n=1 Tax=Homoserinimonas sedimenticola TaxID=2986805 RepID=UPI002235C923|nr:glycine betaine/L-proline ABC transporter ATP-binding protein [Salinibacterium sedimenticola]MCW4384728.1 glycine betaine/L-proline ABC transporter ATP-binding protein [Salinibacterium sedimenticola]
MNENSSSIALSAKNVYKVFGKKPQEAVRRLKSGTSRSELAGHATAAVIDVSFEVKKGEIFVVMGLSGSGKSTLIRMLNGLWEATSGEVIVDGTSITGITPAKLRQVRSEKISMVFQHFALLPHRTVLDNVAYGAELRGVPRSEREKRAREIIELVGLAGNEQKLPDQLSGGMQQRVGLGRALAADTDILLMDEAFSALDPLIRREMQEQLLELQERFGKTIIFITHDLNEAMFLGDRIAVMRDGRVVQIGTPEDILTDPANDYVEQFVQDVDRARVLTAGNVMERPISVVAEGAGPRTALRAMRDTYSSAVYVVGRDRTLRGIVRDRDAIKLVQKGESSLASIIRPVPQAVSVDDVLLDLFVPAIESEVPLAVTDDRSRLVGVIPRVTLLAALGPGTTATGELTIPQQAVPTTVIDELLASGETDAAPAVHGSDPKEVH